MTKQERFERWKASQMAEGWTYEKLKSVGDAQEKHFGWRYPEGSIMANDWKVWDAAAQQKEGYVPAATIREAVIAGWELSAEGHNNEYCTSSQGELNYLFDQAVECVLKAAQEVE